MMVVVSQMRALVLLSILYLGGTSARCLRGGWDRLNRAPRPSNASRATTSSPIDELKLREYLAGDYERLATKACNRVNQAEWNYNVDLLNATAQQETVRGGLGEGL